MVLGQFRFQDTHSYYIKLLFRLLDMKETRKGQMSLKVETEWYRRCTAYIELLK